MIIDKHLARKVIAPRLTNTHKGTFGRVLLIGGNSPYGGAIIMTAIACVNSGAGLVMVATHKDNITALHSHLPEAMAFDMSERKLLLEQCLSADVILIGPGLTEDALAESTLDIVLENVSEYQSLIIDGSALNLLAQKNQIYWKTDRLILTPHQKEWERLSGLPIQKQTQEDTQVALCKFPKMTILVAKSHHTKVYKQDGQVGELAVGGPYQATGGMGDTLAGMIAGFVAQFKSDLFESVAVATYLHSYIADQLAKDAYVVLPTKISEEISRVMKEISKINS